MCGAAQTCDAERHELHANAEHWHDGALTIIVPHAPAWECRSGRSASTLECAVRRRPVTRSVTNCMPTQSIGTMV
ncbi:hypothetical protein ALP59_02410, partial [Pseudomonas savastanoi]